MNEGDSGRSSDAGLRSVGGALELLPESGEEVETVLWGDLVTAAEITDLDPPDDPSDEEAVANYLVRVTAGRTGSGARRPVLVVPPDVVAAERSAELDAFAEELGWCILDVDRFIERRAPPDVVTVFEGRFDVDRSTRRWASRASLRTLGACPSTWSPWPTRRPPRPTPTPTRSSASWPTVCAPPRTSRGAS